METKTVVIYGPPGCAKTTTLINLLSDALSRGIPPQKIGFVSFTKKATEEARDRAAARFKFTADDMPYFRTLHSLCFRQLGMRPSQVMTRARYKEFGKALGVEITGVNNQDEGEAYGLPKGDRILFLCGLARVRCQSLRETWEEVGEDLDFWEVDQFHRAYESFKACHSLRDFTDMLESFAASGSVPDLDILFVDEAQDLSKLQWGVIKKLSANAKEVYLAGDDDQSVYQWSGADVETFINYPGESRVLNQSYRIPSTVHSLSEKIIGKIVRRREKAFRPRSAPGSVSFRGSVEECDLHAGHWLILARNVYQLREIEELCFRSGYHYECRGKSPAKSEALDAVRLYTKGQAGLTLSTEEHNLVNKYRSKKLLGGPWFEALDRLRDEDRGFFLSALRRGEKLTGQPRIRISTIHGSKGGEADNVALLTDMSYKTFESYQKDPDSESRVFYVGATRAKENLHIIMPQTARYFEIC